MNGQVIKEMNERIVKNFMDILIMTEVKNSPMSGYDVISFIHKKFRLLVSSGTVYSLLYSLERDGLIKGKLDNRKRVYALTEKGEENIRAIQEASDQIQNSMSNLFKRCNDNEKTLREDLDTVVYSH
jgi:DNA-binding PadR family transcriptional regulator